MSTSSQKKAGEGDSSGIQTLDWKRLRLIHIFSKPLNYSDTYRARLPVLLFQTSGNCQEPRDPEFPQVRPTSRWARCWRPAVSGAQAHRTSPAGWGSAGTQRPRLCARDLLAFIPGLRCAAGTPRGTWRSWAQTGCLCSVQRQFATSGIEAQLSHGAQLCPGRLSYSRLLRSHSAALWGFHPCWCFLQCAWRTPEVQENLSRWTLGVHLSLPSPEQGSSLS